MSTNRLNKITIIYGLPILIFVLSIVVTISPLLNTHPELALPLTIDLTLLAPLLFLFLSRKSTVPKINAVPFFIIGIVIATNILPTDNQYYLDLLKTYVLPIVELTLISLIFLKTYKAVKIYKSNRNFSSDILFVIKKSTTDILGENRVSNFLASEIGIFYFSIFAWKKVKNKEIEFTHYKENASIAMTLALLMIIGIETFVFHILLIKWNTIAAWVFTGLSIYTTITIFGHLKALLKRPSLLFTDQLILKNGIIADIKISLIDIEKIELCNSQLENSDLNIGTLGLSKESTNHNIAIYFHKSITIEKVYGFQEKCDVLLLHIDDNKTFITKVNTAIKKIEN